MRYAGYMPNDFLNGEGVCVSLWTVGCRHHCKGCHNPELWSTKAGEEHPLYDIKNKIIKAISANDIQRNFSVLGGEPLLDENQLDVAEIIVAVRKAYPNIKIYLWTGYVLEYLEQERKSNKPLDSILNNIDYLIDGPYIQEKRDITLPLRGSRNQRIFQRGLDF